MDAIKRNYFITLSLFPLFQFLFLEFLHKGFILLYGAFGTLLYFVYLFSGAKIKYPKYLLPLILLVINYFIWDLLNNEITILSSGIFSYLYSNLWLHTITILILIENTQFDKRFINTILTIFKVTIVIAFLASIIQLVFNPFFLMPEKLKFIFFDSDQYELRLNSIFISLGPMKVGATFLPIISILIGFYLYKGTSLNIILLAMAGIVLFATKSRWVYLNFIIILMQYPLVNGINITKLIRVSLIILISSVALIIVLNAAGFDFNIFVEERLLSNSASSRFLAFEMFSDFFPKNPFFGSGVHVGDDLRLAIGGRSSQIHVGYLSHLYEFGLIGSLFLFSFLLMVVNKFSSSARMTKYYGSLFAFIALLVANLTLVNFEIFHYGLLFTFIFNKYIVSTNNENPI